MAKDQGELLGGVRLSSSKKMITEGQVGDEGEAGASSLFSSGRGGDTFGRGRRRVRFGRERCDGEATRLIGKKGSAGSEGGGGDQILRLQGLALSDLGGTLEISSTQKKERESFRLSEEVSKSALVSKGGGGQ